MSLTPPAHTRPPSAPHRLDEAALGAWLSRALGGATIDRLSVRQFRGGQSNPTYWLGLDGGAGDAQALVLRKKPPGALLPSAHDVEREYRVLRALDGSGVPAPRALALCEDPSILGTPFYVMAYVPGRIFWDPALPELDARELRRAVHEEYVGALAALHRVRFAELGLADYGRVGGYVSRQLERWTKQYEASRTDAQPAMEALMRWLRGHAPATDETTLIHGDYRIDNLVYTEADEGGPPRARAILDWELSTLGHPISDLAYACLGYHLNLPGRGGLAGADLDALGVPGEAELVDAYCRLTGRRSVADWPYFLAFGLFRLAAIAQGVYARSLAGNASSDDAGSYRAAVGALAELACGLAGVAVRGPVP